MGTDIHAVIQNKNGNKWETIFKLKLNRSYLLFAVLANVRNGFGFAGCYTNDPVIPIDEQRGIPKDYEGDHSELGDHSFSWLMLSEINNYDWDQEITFGGFISPEIQKTYEEGTCPNMWCGKTNNPDYKFVKWKMKIKDMVNPQLLGLIDYYRCGYSPLFENLRLVFGFDS